MQQRCSVHRFIPKNGKLPTSHRYDRIPLLRSRPGDSTGVGCAGLATANIRCFFYVLTNISGISIIAYLAKKQHACVFSAKPCCFLPMFYSLWVVGILNKMRRIYFHWNKECAKPTIKMMQLAWNNRQKGKEVEAAAYSIDNGERVTRENVISLWRPKKWETGPVCLHRFGRKTYELSNPFLIFCQKIHNLCLQNPETYHHDIISRFIPKD